MKRILLIGILTLGTTVVAQAQEQNDSVPSLRVQEGQEQVIPTPEGQETATPEGQATGLGAQDILELTTPIGTDGLLPGGGGSLLMPANASEIAVDPALEARYAMAPSLSYTLFPKGSYLPRWARGYMYGYSSQSASLLYGYAANAGLGIYQQLGDYWTVNAGIDLNKYSVYYNTATVNGMVSWRPNDIFSVTAFGSYMPGSFLSPVQMGTSFQYGGYITLKTTTDVPFGIDLGAREEYDPFTGHTLTPIVRPFVMIGDSKLGIDLGGFLQQHDKKGGRQEGSFNPIPQPIKNLPAVAPRR